MFVITGATGQLGRAIVQNLLQTVPANEIAVSVRDPDRAGDMAELGVRVRRGDFNDADSLPFAFEGATRLMLISSNARATGGDTLSQHRNAIAAAKSVGVTRIFYTSHIGASATSAFAPMHDHAATELMLAQSGLAWTALRHGFYAASAVMLIGDAFKTGMLQAPADGKVAWTTHADLAQAAAAIFCGAQTFDGPTPPLTATEALDLEDIAAIASQLGERHVEREIVPDDAFQTGLAARGLPEGAVATIMGIYLASRAGEFAKTSNLLEQLLGRRPTGMSDVIAAKLANQS